MEKNKLEYHCSDDGGNLRVRIKISNGTEYVIDASKGADWIQITTTEGSMSITPSVSNQVKISTNQ